MSATSRPSSTPAAVAPPVDDDRELVITRTFHAPRALVWEAWTTADRIRQWMAPTDFTIPLVEGELREGGAWREHMVAPDGTEHRCAGVYHEIVPPERLVFTHGWTDGPGRAVQETLVTVTFEERDGRTLMTFRQRGFVSEASRDGHGDGWSECFARLEALLAA